MEMKLMELAMLAAAAGHDMKTRGDIQSEYDRYCAAFIGKDIVAMMSLLASDFEWKMPDGSTFDRAETQAIIDQQLADTLCVHEMSIRIEQIRTSGDQAVVYATERTSVTVTGSPGLLEMITSTETHRDIWAMTPDGWKLKTDEVLLSDATTEPVRMVAQMRAA